MESSKRIRYLKSDTSQNRGRDIIISPFFGLNYLTIFAYNLINSKTMIARFKRDYPKQMLEFFDWFNTFKRLPEWEEYYDEFYNINDSNEISLDEIPMFIKFALFKKFFTKYNIDIDTKEYFHSKEKSLYSNTLIYKEDISTNSDFLTDGESMKDVIVRGLELMVD